MASESERTTPRRITSEEAYQITMGLERCACGAKPDPGYDINGVPTCEHCWEAARDY